MNRPVLGRARRLVPLSVRVRFLRDIWLARAQEPPLGFFVTAESKGVKVLCFDTVLQVLILQGLWKDVSAALLARVAGMGGRSRVMRIANLPR